MTVLKAARRRVLDESNEKLDAWHEMLRRKAAGEVDPGPAVGEEASGGGREQTPEEFLKELLG